MVCFICDFLLFAMEIVFHNTKQCGFFRRKAKEQLKQLKRQTQMLDMNVMMAANFGGDEEDEADELRDDNE